MARARTTITALTLGACALLASGTAPAAATGTSPFPTGEPISDTGYQPAENLPPSEPTRACGTRVVLDEVDRYFAVEERVREYRGGITRIDGRGQLIISVAAEDGRRARLDASGPYTIVVHARTGVTDVYLRGATVLLPRNAIEAAATREAGLPRFAQYSGRTHLRDTSDPRTDEPQASEVLDRPRFVTNACHLLHR